RRGLELKDVAIAAAREAGKLMLDWRKDFPPGPVTMAYKGAKDVITEVDGLAEESIIKKIQQHYPQHNILAEESGDVTAGQSDSPYTWVIDPLDATANYAADLATSCVSIGLAEGEQVVLGVVYNPFRDELFVAERGKGAYLNDYRLSVGQQEQLQKSLVCFDLGYNEARALLQLRQATFLRPRVRTLRILGSSALSLCYVACGRFDLFFHRSLGPWDLAAGMLMVEEAGGILTNDQNQQISYKSKSVVTANPTIHRLFFEALQEYKEVTA
ncbi:MAG: inositol monophosphatase family protein, partial [Chloroflexota bacterium]